MKKKKIKIGNDVPSIDTLTNGSEKEKYKYKYIEIMKC